MKKSRWFEKKFWGLIPLFLILIGIYLSLNYWRSCDEPNIKIPVGENESKVEAARKVMMTYFGHYKHKNSCIKAWVDKYDINEIRVRGFKQEMDGQFVATVNYAIKPNRIIKDNLWIKDVNTNQDGWVDNKQALVTINKSGGFYELKEIINN